MTALESGLATLAPLASAFPSAVSSALAAGEWKYWLPPNYSLHGDAIDNLFVWIFWLTTITFFLVAGTMVFFLIKYRNRGDGRRAIFSHGNTRLEMIWTLVPTVILLVIALATKRVWDNYRLSGIRDDESRAQILVVGEQFKWNFVYPGPDQKLGRYMAYPQPTDGKYKTMTREAALREIGNYIGGTNPLGQLVDPKNPADPGKDDDYARNPGRALIIPANRAIDLHLTAKDVLHDFFLPEFRVKLDAVPGMRGNIYFQTKPEGQSTERMPLENVPADKPIWLDRGTPKVEVGGNPKRYRLYDPTDTRRTPQRRIQIDTMETLADGARRRLTRQGILPDQVAKDPALVPAEVEKFKADLRAQGISDLSVIKRKYEIVCEELCGPGHSTMRGEMIVVSNDEYMNFLNLSAPAVSPTPPTTRPAQPIAAAEPATGIAGSATVAAQ